jgi:hypothetical protein
VKFDQAKIALTLVQEWPLKNEVIDLCNKFFWKKQHIKSVIFETHSNKSYPKKVNILFVIKFRRNFRILSFKLYNKIFVIALVNLTV